MIATQDLLIYGLPVALLLVMAARKKAITMNKNVNNLTAADAENLIKEQKKLLILDVRSPGEFAGGRIPGAINIPVQELPRRLAEIGDDKTRPILVYCASGGRSPGAVRALLNEGFTHLYHLSRGMVSWRGPVKR